MPTGSCQDVILLEGLEIECIIGIYGHERTTPQRLVVEVALSVGTETAALSARIEQTVDYEWVTNQIAFILKTGKFELLETAAHAVCRALLLAPVSGEQRCPIDAVTLALKKPGALGGKGIPTLRVTRCASDMKYDQEMKAFGRVDIIFESRDIGIYRLNVEPGKSIGLHRHEIMVESEFVLSHGLHCQGKPAHCATVRVWPKALPHRYDNPGAKVESILCIDRPAFIPSDEIPMTGQPGESHPVNAWEL
jgi:dihydroneopterin aldolase